MSARETVAITASPERVRQIRDEMSCGLIEARRAAMHEALDQALDRATTVDDLRPILRVLILGWAGDR